MKNKSEMMQEETTTSFKTLFRFLQNISYSICFLFPICSNILCTLKQCKCESLFNLTNLSSKFRQGLVKGTVSSPCSSQWAEILSLPLHPHTSQYCSPTYSSSLQKSLLICSKIQFFSFVIQLICCSSSITRYKSKSICYLSPL